MKTLRLAVCTAYCQKGGMNCLLFFIFLGLVPAMPASAMQLLPHRAIYDISLVMGKGRNSLIAASGHLTYEFTGNECEGYSTKTRFVSALRSQDGSQMFNDIKSATFEKPDGEQFRFITRTSSNGKVSEEANGVAEYDAQGKLHVAIDRPKRLLRQFETGSAFPVMHMKRLLEAARKRETIARVDLFDGTAGGQKIYATAAVIGNPIDTPIPEGHPAAHASFAQLARYPISLSFFDQATDHSGEQTALYDTYAIMFDNGVTYEIRLDYAQFSFAAEMKSLEVLPSGECKQD